MTTPPPNVPGLIIAAPASGCGKTTVTLGLLRALARRGQIVQPFKCGPDYIDPAFHSLAAGRASHNLDTWAMRRDLIAHIVTRESARAAVIIAEGVMGLFDGVAMPGQTARASTADLAALMGWPVVLVLDVSAQAETAAAVALGMAHYRDDVRIAGVILNRVGGAAHAAMIAPPLEASGFRCFGAVTRDIALMLPERHLGLVQASETADIEGTLDRIAAALAQSIDLDAVCAAAQPARIAPTANARIAIAPPGQRIALAHDAAFAFAYPHIVEGWRDAGAEIVPFSPLADHPPDAAADAVWLPGGYPELHAGTLAAAARFKAGLAALAERTVPIHGECGGYMVLGTGLEDAGGCRHAMAGLLDVETSFAKPRMHLGYRRARLVGGSPLGETGTEVYGHEFHFATLLAQRDAPLLSAVDADASHVAETGARRGSVSGTFLHVIDRAG